MIEVDGSWGEGGGQILRTSLALSCLTGKPVRVFNIRAGRKKPGLKPQHLLSAYAAAKITGGRLEGAGIGSTEMAFYPGGLVPGNYLFDVASIASSAGSTGLVFQTVALPLSFAPGESSVTIRGGTHVEWSPSADYIKEVFIPAAARLGLKLHVECPVKGFYPIGGGEVTVKVEPAQRPLLPLDATERGGLLAIRIVSAVANLPLSIAERQLKRAIERLGVLDTGAIEPAGECIEVKSPGHGTFLFILAEYENTRAGFQALGARGKRAEEVAGEAADLFIRYFKRKGTLDPHLSDQLVLPMALANGESRATTSEVTNHLKTNIHVIESFLPVKFTLLGETGEEGLITVKGTGRLFEGNFL